MLIRLVTDPSPQTMFAVGCLTAAMVIGGGACVLYDLLAWSPVPNSSAR